MVEMGMAEEDVDGLLVLDQIVDLIESVSCVQDDMVLFGVHEQAGGPPCLGIVPSIGPRECYLDRHRINIAGPATISLAVWAPLSRGM